MVEQRELVFHDTVPFSEDQLEKARMSAKKQRAVILAFFEKHRNFKMTPPEVEEMTGIMLNSVRRTITNLTKEGRLIKCQWSEREMGKFGRDNRTWRFNTEYLPPLNLKITTVKDFEK